MINFLFWNVKGEPACLGELVREHAVDVLLLAENRAAPDKILAELERVSGGEFQHDPLCRGGIAMFTRFARRHVDVELDEKDFCIRRLRAVPHDVLLVLLHFPSKTGGRSADDQAALSTEYARDIRDVEKKVGHQRTVLVGDLNMNPFERGMVQANGFHAVMCRRVAARRERTVDGRSYPLFYNPMWNLFGDNRGAPPGTFYRDKGDIMSFFWNMYDQVLVRPDVVQRFVLDRLQILAQSGATALVNDGGRPHISDHLPIFFQLDLDLPGASHVESHDP